MSNNSSSSSSHLLPNPSNRMQIYISAISLKIILIIPLSTFILYLALQKWRQQRSFKSVSHSDIFTYHLAVNELVAGLGIICFLIGAYSNNEHIVFLGFCGWCTSFYCEMFFHVLTCVERYLAVVHPVTYLSLRNTRGVRIRNISSGCVWLLSFGLVCSTAFGKTKNAPTTLLCVLFVFLIIVTFCSLSVLCALIRPGPGEGGRERVDQSKQRAFHTITAIWIVLLVCFVGFLVCNILNVSSQLSDTDLSLMNVSVFWFSLPSGLVSPLFYLHKDGKIPCKSFHFK